MRRNLKYWVPALVLLVLAAAYLLFGIHVVHVYEADTTLGYQQYLRGDYDRAIARFDRALAGKPDYPRAWFYRALACEKVGLPQAAAEAYRQFLKTARGSYWDEKKATARKRIKEIEAEHGTLARPHRDGGDADVKPRIEIKEDTPVLILPDSLKAAMKKYNRRMQLRNWDDYRPVDLEGFRSTHAKRIPWAVWGDFDGNGRTDVALDLRDAKKSMGKVVAYHQLRSGEWRAHLLTQYGSELAKDPDYFLFLTPGPHSAGPHDLITYGVPDSDVCVYFYWKDGKYHWEDCYGFEGDTP